MIARAPIRQPRLRATGPDRPGRRRPRRRGPIPRGGGEAGTGAGLRMGAERDRCATSATWRKKGATSPWRWRTTGRAWPLPGARRPALHGRCARRHGRRGGPASAGAGGSPVRRGVDPARAARCRSPTMGAPGPRATAGGGAGGSRRGGLRRRVGGGAALPLETAVTEALTDGAVEEAVASRVIRPDPAVRPG